MNLKSLVASIGVSSLIFAGALTFTSCVPKVTEEQLAQLQELRKKEKQLTQDIANKQSDNSKLEGEINARQAVLNDCNKDKEFIMQKLSQWPNVWPDYNPNK
jgi:septal ring factor EnvC (AmiA/AmiB activator)